MGAVGLQALLCMTASLRAAQASCGLIHTHGHPRCSWRVCRFWETEKGCVRAHIHVCSSVQGGWQLAPVPSHRTSILSKKLLVLNVPRRGPWSMLDMGCPERSEPWPWAATSLKLTTASRTAQGTQDGAPRAGHTAAGQQGAAGLAERSFNPCTQSLQGITTRVWCVQ